MNRAGTIPSKSVVPNPDYHRLLGLLEDGARAPEVPWLELPEWMNPKWARAAEIGTRFNLPRKLLQEIASLLRAIDEVESVADGYIDVGGFRNQFRLDMIVHWLLVRAREGTAANALGQLVEFGRHPEVPTVQIAAIQGIKINAPVDIDKETRLVPWASQPDPVGGRQFVPVMMAPVAVMAQDQFVALPDAAVVGPGKGRFVPKGQGHTDITTGGSLVVRSVLDLLPAVIPCRIVQRGTWHAPDASVPCSDLIGRGYVNWERHASPLMATELDAEATTRLADLYGAYMNLDDTTHAQLAIPLHRLNRSCGGNGVDAAIDLGIALEALLLRDSDGELSYRLASRGAWFGGETPQRRRELYDVLRSVYRLRSLGVHSGAIASGGEKQVAAQETIREGQRICAALLRKMIQQQRFPDWADVVLGVSS